MSDAGDGVPIVELLDERRLLLDVGYWMLGSGCAAEGVVAEVYRRWYELPDAVRGRISVPRCWLVRVAGGICLARLALPGGQEGDGRALDRADGDSGTGTDREAETKTGSGGVLEEEVSAVLLGALDALSPVERAAFVLNDVFGMAPGVIADIVGQAESEVAELADRARRSLRVRRSRATTPQQHDGVVRAVRQACVTEDAAFLASLLAADATVFFDGGGKVRALSKPVHGSRQVAHSLLTLLARHPRTTLRTHSVNGRTGLVVRYDDQVAAVISLDIDGDHVVQVWVTLNPDKLRTWNQPDPGTHP
ncbi:RNA polymerase subunit sigma [Streptomyces sp. NPDC050704]|uniref:RNA polymerase subunit sigma n=1 Tax=Streptomyces sp. NPDC050704 TaxID=3157219 RepID=UPI00343C2868